MKKVDVDSVIQTSKYPDLPFSSSSDVLLSVILLFSELSPKSNVLCSPAINFRKVEQQNYTMPDDKYNHSMFESVMDVDRKDSFQNSSLHLMSFKTLYDDKTQSKSHYESIGKVEYEIEHDKKTTNTLVTLQNVFVNSMDIEEITVLECIFGIDLNKQEKPCTNGHANIFHFNKLLSVFSFWKNELNVSKENFTQLWSNLEMPDITEDIVNLNDIFREAHDWFSFLTDFKISLIEGNHRLEMFARLMLGYDINVPVPLKKKESPTIMPEQSTVYRSIPCVFYHQRFCTVDNRFLKLLKEHSMDIQRSKQVYIETTWQSLLRRIAEDIRTKTDYGEAPEFTIDAFTWLGTEYRETSHEQKLVKIHNSLIQIIHDNIFQHEPSRTALKDVNRQELEQAINKSTTYKIGKTSHFYTNVSHCVNILTVRFQKQN